VAVIIARVGAKPTRRKRVAEPTVDLDAGTIAVVAPVPAHHL